MSEDSEKTKQSQGASFADSEATIRDDVTPLRRRPKVGCMLLGRYEILSELGQGGMGVVYHCLDRTGGVEVAVKALPPELSHSPVEMEEVRENYKLVSSLFHPNIAACRTLEADPTTGDYYLVMEYVKGEELRRWMKRKRHEGTLTLEMVLPILMQVADALDFAHDKKIMHRDIKPGNIMVDAGGTVKVLDFGLAAQIQSSMSRMSTAVTSQSGTRQYKAPEQWRGQPQVAATDQYALAVTAYEMLSGHVPFDDADVAVLREVVLKEQPAKIDGVPDYVNDALFRGLAKDSNERFASCMDFINTLENKKDRASRDSFRAKKPTDVQNNVDTDTNKKNQSTDRRGKRLIVEAIVFIILLLIFGVSFFMKNENEDWKIPFEKLFEKYKTASAEGSFNETLTLADNVKLELVKIKAGSFVMGSPVDELGRRDNENQHRVTLTQDYWLGKYEVTQAQWKAVMVRNPNPSEFPKGDKYPLENVSWDYAMEFCRRLTEKERSAGRLPEGYEYTLPTEAQWEYAARGGHMSKEYQVYSGGDHLDNVGWYEDNSEKSTHPVGLKQANELGLYDMNGNVWEWCRDCFENYPNNGVSDPVGPASGTPRILRGGSWCFNDEQCRSAFRGGVNRARNYGSHGFRVALAPVILSEAKGDERSEELPNKIVKLRNGVLLELVGIKAGSFMMGSPASEKGRRNEEKQHHVTLTQDYWLGKYEVTQAQYEALMGTNPSTKKVEDNCPVVDVSWNDAMEFCRLLTQREKWAERLPEGYEYTLPTEAQWEYAARGGHKANGYHIYCGSDTINDVGWFGGNSDNSIHQVGMKQANELGLYDMTGNVWEWCLDRFVDTRSDTSADSHIPLGKHLRVVKGGSWNNNAVDCRVTHRHGDSESSFDSLGFRLALAPVKTSNKKEEAKYSTLIASFNDKEETISDMSGKVVMLPNDVPLELVGVKAGSFMMGSPENEHGRKKDEIQHRVIFTRNFWIGKYEVTQAQYEAIMGGNPSEFKKGENYPVEQVSWKDAMEFCRRLTKREKMAERLPNGYEYILPTEAQWEYAARGGHKSNGYHVYGIDETVDSVGWYRGNSNSSTHYVGRKSENELGLYDMIGNVWEWCLDSCDFDDHLGIVTDTYKNNIVNPYCDKGISRIFRGGAFLFDVDFCRLASRFSGDISRRYNFVGFRVALVPVIDTFSVDLMKDESTTIHSEFEKLPPELVKVNAGSFRMGSHENELERESEELLHQVTLTKDFWIGKYEITQAQYKAITENNPSKFQVGDNYPVEQISWEEAMKFCKKLTENEQLAGRLPNGYEYTLPTEAQWEYAARGGHKSNVYHIYSGNDTIDLVGWYWNNSDGSTHPVGEKKENELGIYDMTGNVSEWCRDSCDYYSGVITNTYKDGVLDPYCCNGLSRVIRGGNWNSNAEHCRSAYRFLHKPLNRSDNIGFRVVLAPVQ